eukprot:gene14137-biopygen9618
MTGQRLGWAEVEQDLSRTWTGLGRDLSRIWAGLSSWLGGPRKLSADRSVTRTNLDKCTHFQVWAGARLGGGWAQLGRRLGACIHGASLRRACVELAQSLRKAGCMHTWNMVHTRRLGGALAEVGRDLGVTWARYASDTHWIRMGHASGAYTVHTRRKLA